MPWTRWLVNNRNLFLTILEAEKSKIKVMLDVVSGEALLSNSQMAVFLPGERGEDLSGISFIRTTVTFMKAPSS